MFDADLIQLAGMKSIEAAGGPQVPFTPGAFCLHIAILSICGFSLTRDLPGDIHIAMLNLGVMHRQGARTHGHFRHLAVCLILWEVSQVFPPSYAQLFAQLAPGYCADGAYVTSKSMHQIAMVARANPELPVHLKLVAKRLGLPMRRLVALMGGASAGSLSLI